jgi:hypothetical protein
MAHTRTGQALPTVGGFRDTLLIGAGICTATAVVSFVLPGRTVERGPAPSTREGQELAETMVEEAELAGAGLVLAEANAAGSQEEAQ